VKFPQRKREGELTVRLNMNERRAVIRVQALRYRKARKKEKGRILDEVVKLTGYHRWYAVRLLALQGKAIRVGRHQQLAWAVGSSVKR
jgi:hypothetical protein